jgi:hypothetical protein
MSGNPNMRPACEDGGCGIAARKGGTATKLSTAARGIRSSVDLMIEGCKWVS